MAQAALGAAGLHFDELNKLRVLEPEVAAQTAQLREQCRAFVDKTAEFQNIVGSLIELVDQLAKAVESEKMKAIGARNLLKSIAKQREAQEQQLQALIAEKKMQLESPTCSKGVSWPEHMAAVPQAWSYLQALQGTKEGSSLRTPGLNRGSRGWGSAEL
ncbi:intraflagellar transport protein 20 homolog isoform X1 [Motacilla alba alba]|uniref:intraflagellar transport protein 20 homolog isoform X1 n=1 Tax=Motacilla alba alba TaxID=1094192 RepID=UPI0018D529FB|nr:intraflagellar transport protein 20 homolog isoform X1 [Motacilla alba alba]